MNKTYGQCEAFYIAEDAADLPYSIIANTDTTLFSSSGIPVNYIFAALASAAQVCTISFFFHKSIIEGAGMTAGIHVLIGTYTNDIVKSGINAGAVAGLAVTFTGIVADFFNDNVVAAIGYAHGVVNHVGVASNVVIGAGAAGNIAGVAAAAVICSLEVYNYYNKEALTSQMVDSVEVMGNVTEAEVLVA